MPTRQRLGRIAAVTAALVVAFGGGAVAKDTYDARNADKVDGLHAVPASASLTAGKGRLVATSPKTGKLPDDLIGVAPRARAAGDAERLGGRPASDYRSLTLPVEGTWTTGSASRSQQGVYLYANDGGSAQWTWVMPADYRTGSPVLVDLVYREDSSSSCSWYVSASGLNQLGPDFTNGGWYLPGSNAFEGPVSVPAGDGNAHTATFRSPYAASIRPGTLLQFLVNRSGAQGADNCDSVILMGLRVRY